RTRRNLPALHGAHGARRLRPALPEAPVRRHAATPGIGARLRSEAPVPADGRAVWRTGCADTLGHAGPALAGVAGRRQDGPADHPFGRGSHLSVIAHRRGDGAAGAYPRRDRRALWLSTRRERA